MEEACRMGKDNKTMLVSKREEKKKLKIAKKQATMRRR
jgi:hypothetical protein